MRRYRNARFAPESLERKLSPSAIGLFPATAHVAFVSHATAVSAKTSLTVHTTPSPVQHAAVRSMGMMMSPSNIENPGGPTDPTTPTTPNPPTGPTNPTLVLGD